METYKNTNKGLVLVINNYKFRSVPDRTYSSKDSIELLMLLFNLGYSVDIKSNLSIPDILKCMEEFTLDPRHEFSDSTIVVLMSYGYGKDIYGSDENCIDLYKIHKILDKCYFLLNKPKIFIVHSCNPSNQYKFFMHPEVDADNIIYYNCTSVLDENGGSLFISTLCKVLDSDNDIMSLITEINDSLVRNYHFTIVPFNHFTLRKKLYLK